MGSKTLKVRITEEYVNGSLVVSLETKVACTTGFRYKG